MTQSTNPLRQYFRQPVIYVRLPSGGKFWKQGALQMPQNQELPVYPMTAVDEITYRTPDALFNGQAVVDVIQSCVPAVLNAWETPIVDLNSLLIAIRIASYGHEMELSTACPKCSETDDFALDIRSVLDQMRSPDYATTVQHGDLEIQFCPMTYEQQNKSNLEQWENQKIITVIPDSDLADEEKIRKMTEVMKSITHLTVRALKHSIAHIRTPQAIVTDPEHIEEFLTKCERQIFNSIRDHAVRLRENTELQPLKLTCPHCANQYEQPVSLDQANFFAAAS